MLSLEKPLRYLKRAASLPPHITLQKIGYKLKGKYKEWKEERLDEKYPTYEKSRPNLTLNRFLKPIDLSLLPQETILRFNEKILRHEFDLLGSGPTPLFPGKGKINRSNRAESSRIGELIEPPYRSIDWQLDFKSGYRWDIGTWSRKIEYGSRPGVDVKVPWELSRMHHLVSLAWGYALEKRGDYLAEFQNQILDFIASNPPRYGVNWSCTMDVGIRIANWLFAFDLFAAYEAPFDPRFEEIFKQSAYEHGLHIRGHLEWDPYLRSNHYLANLGGLLFVSAYLEGSGEIGSWFDFAVRELIEEVKLQFHPDGSNFEASSSYHRLSAEIALYSTALALEKGVEFPPLYQDRIQKMGDFIRDITKPDGTIVQVGDNDSGRFLQILPGQTVLEHLYLVRPIRNLKNLSSLIESHFGLEKEEGPTWCAYPDFGLYIEKNSFSFLSVRCGPIGQRGNGGHAHNDQLSFELSVHGIPLLIDPGTYVYTPHPEMRRRFRSTRMHNTLVPDSELEQNKEEGLFQMKERAFGKTLLFQKGVWIGEHRGFGPSHRRTLSLFENRLEGVDEFEGKGSLFFHLAPGWEPLSISDRHIEWSFGSLRVSAMADRGRWAFEQGEYSKEYGKKEKSPISVLQGFSQRAEWKIIWRAL